MQRRGWLVGLFLIPVLALGWLASRDGRSSATRSADAETSSRAAAPGQPRSQTHTPDETPAHASLREEAEADPGVAGPLPVAADRALVVTVVDPDGSRLAGVRVQASDPGGWSGEGTTREDGKAELVVPPELETLVLLVEREGFVHRRLEREATKPVTVILHPALVLTGRVLDQDTGRALAGAVVEREHAGCSGCAADRSLTDGAGRYRLPGVPVGSSAGALCFLVRAAGYVGRRDEFFVREPVAELARDFELRARAELHGRVVDFETGAPVAGASVRFGIDVMLTDESGSFSSSRTAALDRATDRWPTERLEVRAPLHASLSMGIEGFAPPFVARLPRGARITGTVRAADGRPVANARVALQNRGDFSERALSATPLAQLPESWNLSDAEKQTRSGADGTYRFDGVVPWCDAHVLWLSREGTQPRQTQVPALAPGQEHELDLRLGNLSGGTVSGEVTFNGKPAKGTVHANGGFDGVSATLRDGRYRLEGVPAGSVRLVVRLENLSVDGLIPDARAALALEAGQELRRDFHLELPMTAIAGRVLRADGTPAGDVQVKVESAKPYYSRSVRTGKLGAYRVAVPDRGLSFVVIASVGRISDVRRDVPAGSKGVDLVLPKLGEVLVRVLPRAREPADPFDPGFRISWKPAGSGSFEEVQLEPRDEQGFSRLRLPAGSVDLRVTEEREGGASEQRLAVSVHEVGEPERVTFDLARER